ncbi:DnaT-like ssDNA-binding protein [Ensifer sp. KUDG1]|uniref:DnaT-like ssDNA-binding protein n=1 Tax=Ensifer sp. KUDG1 TaxID=3373919 RepID=UPI003D20FE73
MAGYGTDSVFQQWLDDNGYQLPSGSPTAAVLRQRGSQYIDAVYGSRFVGVIADAAQERQWPREGAIVSGKLIPSDVVPAAVINASYYAAYQEATKPGSLSVVGSGATRVKRKKVGQLEVEYQAASDDSETGSDLTPIISIVDGMLAPFLRDDSLVCVGIMSVGC